MLPLDDFEKQYNRKLYKEKRLEEIMTYISERKSLSNGELDGAFKIKNLVGKRVLNFSNRLLSITLIRMVERGVAVDRHGEHLSIVVWCGDKGREYWETFASEEERDARFSEIEFIINNSK